MTTAWDRVIYEEHSILTFCRQDSPRSRHQQHRCLKRNVLCVKDGTICRSSEGSNACLHNRKTTEERGNVCWNFKPFCKGVNLLLQDRVRMAQSPPTDWASICVPLRLMGQSDLLEGTQSNCGLLWLAHCIFACIICFAFSLIFWWEVWG